MSNIEIFKEINPSLESYYRSIVLFGRNVATYKFALGKSLLEIAPTGKNEVTLEELAVPFSKHICEHIAKSPKQATSSSSKFLEACSNFNSGIITHDQLISTTVKLGFNNVIDAFHIVNSGAIPIEFYKKEYNGRNKKIILTDNIFELNQMVYSGNFLEETESRWNLVETAWELKISPNLMNVEYDDAKKIFVVNDKLRRKDVTSARGALNGYQKGKCFYCYDDISIENNSSNMCDVDHFFPYTLQPIVPKVNLNGVWNLVLTCNSCNRGEDGKFAKVPALKYLERLHKRNEYLISSHHPLRETIINQTGKTVEDRIAFLRGIDRIAKSTLIHRWETDAIGDETF